MYSALFFFLLFIYLTTTNKLSDIYFSLNKESMIPEEITKTIQPEHPIHADVIIDSSQSKRKIKYSEATKFGDISVQIIPSSLDFDYRAIGEEAQLDIIFVNVDTHNELVIFNVVSDYLNIDIPSLNSNVVEAGKNLTIPINYIPTHVDGDYTMISIMTSVGTFQYEIKGKGYHSPHKMKTYVGKKIPVGVLYEESIIVYNPANTLLQIEEIYLHNNFLNFTLPDTLETSSWQIEPHSEKSIINFSFISHTPGKFAGNIVIKTNADVSLISVVQIFVVKDDVFALPEEIDFGILTSTSETATALVSLLNSGSDPIKILDLYENSDSKQLSILLTHINVDSVTESDIAQITFTGFVKGQTTGFAKGKLTMLLKTLDGNPYNSRKEIDYKARVIPGFLEFQKSSTTFPLSISDSQDKIEQHLVLTNKFSEAIYIIFVEILDSNFVPKYTPSIIEPGESFNIYIALYPGKYDMFSTTLKVITNITVIDIPLHCYNGKLDVFVKDEELFIDYGIISIDNTKYTPITITNNNPVRISVRDIVSEDRVQINLQSILDSNGNEVNRNSYNYHSKTLTFSLEPGDTAFLRSEITSNIAEHISGDILIISEFENITLPYTCQAIEGTITYSPSSLDFINMFPGQIFSETIYAYNLYPQPLKILSIIPSDSRFQVKLTDNVLLPSQSTPIAEVSVNSSLFVDDTLLIYLSHTFLFDSEHYLERIYSDYLDYWNFSSHDVRTILTVNTGIDTSYTILARATLDRPMLRIKSEIRFPKTQVHKSSGLYFPIYNPSNSPIIIKIITFENVNSPFFLPTEMDQILIPTRTTYEFGPIIFSPQDLEDYEAKVYLLNNFSFIEPLLLTGSGGASQLEIISDFSELLPTNDRLFTSKEFSIVNTGDMPLHSIGVYINDAFCTGYGFQILDCGSQFLLNPGEFKNLTLVTINTDIDPSIYHKLVISTSVIDFEFPLNYDISTLSQFTVLSLFMDSAMVVLLCTSFISFLKFDELVLAFLIGRLFSSTDKNPHVKSIETKSPAKKNPTSPLKSKKTITGNQNKKIKTMNKMPPVIVHAAKKDKVPKKVVTPGKSENFAQKVPHPEDSVTNLQENTITEIVPKKQPTSPTKSFIQQSVEKKYRKVDPLDKKDKQEKRRLKRLSKPKLEELYTGPGLKLGNVNQTEEFKKFMDVRKEKDKSASLPNFTNLPKVTPKKESPNKMSHTMVSLPNIKEMKRYNQSSPVKKNYEKKRSSKTPEKTRLSGILDKRKAKTPEKRSKKSENVQSKTPEKKRNTNDQTTNRRKPQERKRAAKVQKEVVPEIAPEVEPEVIPTDVLFIAHQKKTQIVFEESSSDESSELNPPGFRRSVESVHGEKEGVSKQENDTQNYSMTYPPHNPTPLLNYEDIKRKSHSPPPQLSIKFDDFSNRPSRYQFENNRSTSPPITQTVPQVYFNAQTSIGEPSPIKYTFGEQDPLAWKSGKSPRNAPTTGVIGDRQVSQQPGYSQFDTGSSLWERLPILGTETDQEDRDQFRSFFSNDTLFSETPKKGNDSLFFEINQ